jgi:hypothetical protein
VKWTSVAAIAVALLAGQVGAGVLTVDCSGRGDFVTLQDALSACSPGDTVLVEPGVYNGPGNRDLVPVNQTTIIGVGGASGTVIDCESMGKGFELDQRPGCLFIGLTITRGQSGAGLYPKAAGGGVYSYDSSPTFVDCVFTECRASNLGGAVYSYLEAPVFLGCVFTGNSCHSGYTSYGGGGVAIRHLAGDCEIVSCLFDGNEAASCGGAINVQYGDGAVVVSETSFIGNGAVDFCGAVRLYDVPSTFTNCTFACNHSGSGCSSLCGGSSDAPLEIRRCILSFGSGGVAAFDCAEAVFEHCCVFGNADGDAFPGGLPGNMIADPEYCDLSGHDLLLNVSSPCLPANNDWGVLVGAYGEGCGEVPVEDTSWTRMKSLYRHD